MTMKNDVMWIAVTPDEHEVIIAFGDTQLQLSQYLGVRTECIPRNYRKSSSIPVGAPHKSHERFRIRRITIDEEA